MQYKKTILKNGLRIITVPMKDNPTVTVLVLVEAGSKYETKDKNGISHFLEHMCFKGTVKRPSNTEISSELDSLGAHYNAYTGDERTGYYAKVEYQQLDKVLDIISDMYLNPLLPDKEIEKEKGVIIEEINMCEDLPKRKVQIVFLELLYGDQPAGREVLGPKENINKMAREDFVSYRDKFYVPKATTVVVAGNFNEAKAVKSISNIFGKIKEKNKGEKVKTNEKQQKPQVKIFNKDTDQTHLVLGVRTFDIYDKRNPAINVLRGILSGGMSARLFKKMRDEMGICYYVHAGVDSATDCGYFSVSAGVDSRRVKEAISVILAEFNDLKEKLISPEELKRVKQQIAGSLFLSLESSDSLAEFYGDQEIMNEKIKTPEEIKKEIEAVTAEDIKKLAKQVFVDAGLNLALVGRFPDKKQFEDILKF